MDDNASAVLAWWLYTGARIRQAPDEEMNRTPLREVNFVKHKNLPLIELTVKVVEHSFCGAYRKWSNPTEQRGWQRKVESSEAIEPDIVLVLCTTTSASLKQAV